MKDVKAFGHNRTECKSKRDVTNSLTKPTETPITNLAVIEPNYKAQSFYIVHKDPKSEEIKFIIDSGASDHFVSESKNVQDKKYLNSPVNIKIAQKGNSIQALAFGIIECLSNLNIKCSLKDVLITPDIPNNLLSVGRLTDHELNVLFTKEKVTVFRATDNVIVAIGKRKGNLYEITFVVPEDNNVNSPENPGPCHWPPPFQIWP